MLKLPCFALSTLWISFFLLFCLPATSFAEAVFQDNFDAQPEGASCETVDLTGWGSWHCSGGTSATLDGTTHKSGEVTSPGRGGSGKSLKLWRHSGVFGDYTGVPYKGVGGDIWNTGISNIYMRYYIKLPTSFVSSEDFKMWRLGTANGSEVYLNMRDPNAGNPSRTNATLGIYDGGPWVTVLSNAELQAIWDGNWHSIEFHIGLSTHALEVWTDGALRYSSLSHNWTATGLLTGMQHFAIGNTYSHNGTWQNSWQAMELDDLVIADEYIGPLGGSADTTAPTVSITAPGSGATVAGTTTISANASDNVGVIGVQFKIDGNNLGTEDTSPPYQYSWNTTSVANGTHVLTATARDGAGNTATSSPVTVVRGASTVFFSEGYEDTNFANRGWYDVTNGTIDTTQYHSGAGSLRCVYNLGSTNCTAPKRHKFTESESVYVSYWVKYSTNFVGSGQGYHPHEFLFLTNLNGDYDGLAFDYLTMYLESHWNSSANGFMYAGFQDGQNIDQANIGQNLIGVTENRAVAGCNGSPSGYAGGCYDRGDGVYVNGVLLDTAQTFTTANKNNWNHVEVYYRLNSLNSGIGQANGIIRVWFNNSLVLERTTAILRTGQRPTMKFNQFIFAPWIGDGSPINQTMWIDDLVVGAERLGNPTLSTPGNLRLNTP